MNHLGLEEGKNQTITLGWKKSHSIFISHHGELCNGRVRVAFHPYWLMIDWLGGICVKGGIWVKGGICRDRWPVRHDRRHVEQRHLMIDVVSFQASTRVTPSTPWKSSAYCDDDMTFRTFIIHQHHHLSTCICALWTLWKFNNGQEDEKNGKKSDFALHLILPILMFHWLFCQCFRHGIFNRTLLMSMSMSVCLSVNLSVYLAILQFLSLYFASLSFVIPNSPI